MKSNITVLDQVDNVFEVEFIKFSDGAETCIVKGIRHRDEVHYSNTELSIELVIVETNRDLIRLLLIHDALSSLGYKDMKLFMAYVPNARADRKFVEGGSHGLRVFAKLVNSLKFKSVIIEDPHSDVTEALFDNVLIHTQKEIFLTFYKNEVSAYLKGAPYLLAAPDLGSTKKTFDLMMALGQVDMIQGIKIRDVTTGSIVKCGLVCDTDLREQHVLIVDDISDGGASFKFLAAKLLERNCGKIILYTTHGIYSKGLEVMKGYVDYIIAHNIIGEYITQDDISKFNKAGE